MSQVALVTTQGSPMAVSLVSAKKATDCDYQHLLALAENISTAGSHIKAGTTGKLKQIYQQIQALQSQAKGVLESAKRDKQLHQAACNLQKKPGHFYHLYEKVLKNGETEAYFSIMSPSDWAGKCPHEYIASYKMGYDHSFVEIEKLEEHEKLTGYIESVYEKVISGGDNRLEWKF